MECRYEFKGYEKESTGVVVRAVKLRSVAVFGGEGTWEESDCWVVIKIAGRAEVSYFPFAQLPSPSTKFDRTKRLAQRSRRNS